MNQAHNMKMADSFDQYNELSLDASQPFEAHCEQDDGLDIKLIIEVTQQWDIHFTTGTSSATVILDGIEQYILDCEHYGDRFLLQWMKWLLNENWFRSW